MKQKNYFFGGIVLVTTFFFFSFLLVSALGVDIPAPKIGTGGVNVTNGTLNHNELFNLDYASSGHTGFAPITSIYWNQTANGLFPINNSKRVGIGLTEPVSKLNVKDNLTTILTISSGIGNENASLDFREGDTIRARIEYSGLDGGLRFWSLYGDGNYDELMYFNTRTPNEIRTFQNFSASNLYAQNICYTNGTGCNGTISNHTLLSNLLWSVANHTIDSSVDFNNNDLLAVNVIEDANGNPMIDVWNKYFYKVGAVLVWNWESGTWYANQHFKNITAENICYTNGTGCNETFGANPFDQSLNTTDVVNFSRMISTNGMIIGKAINPKLGLLSIPYSADFENQAFTYNLWVKFKSFHATPEYTPFISQSQGGFYWTWWYDNTDSKFYFKYRDGTSTEYTIASNAYTLNLNTYYMVSIKRTAGGQIIFFVNSGGKGGATEATNIDYTNIGAEDIDIGYRQGFDPYIDADLDELGMWNTNSIDLSNLYNSGVGTYGDIANAPFNANFICGFHFDKTTTDFGASGHDATIALPLWNLGKVLLNTTITDTGEGIVGGLARVSQIKVNDLIFSDGTYQDTKGLINPMSVDLSMLTNAVTFNDGVTESYVGRLYAGFLALGAGGNDGGQQIIIPTVSGNGFYYGYGGTDTHYFGGGGQCSIDSVGNIATSGTITGSNLCYSDGTGCMSISMDYTNIALINESVSWTTGNNITMGDGGWFKGLFNWTTLNDWLIFDGTLLSFNDTKLNETINNIITQPNQNRTFYNISITNVATIQTLNVIGNISGNTMYGSMYNFSDAGWMIGIASSGVYYNLSVSTAGELNGFNVIQDGATGTKLQAQVSGYYSIDGILSGEFAGGEYGVGIVTNGADPEVIGRCYSRINLNAETSVPITCIKRLEAGDNITMVIDDEGFPVKDVKVHNINIKAFKIGN